MQVTPDEAKESLAAIEAMMQKVRHSLARSDTPYHLLIWGTVWLLGFLGSHFLSGRTSGFAWLALDVLGAIGSAVAGTVAGRRVRQVDSPATSRRIGMFWLALFLYCGLAVWIAAPLTGRQLAMLIVLFAMLGWMAMGFLLSIAAVRLALLVTAIALAGYFLLPEYFFLWMALLGGGTMIGGGLYVLMKWRRP